MELLRKGDAESIERAIALLQGTVFSFSMKVCGQRQDAEDTAQEVLFRSLPHLAQIGDPQALTAWLYTAAKNRCWQHRRKLSYRKAVSLEDLLPGEAELKTLLLADPAPGPDAETLSREDHRLLHRAVLTLPAPYRIVLVLHDMEELDTDQVARILALRPGTVRIRLHRARLMVRQEVSRRLRGPQSEPRRRKPGLARGAECRELFANLSDYLDGRLQPESCEQMQRHIDACPACVVFIQDLKRAIDRCRSLDVCPDSEASPALRRLLTEEYLRLIKNSTTNL